MEIKFLVLDASYEIWGKEPVVLLWAHNDKGEPIVVFDNTFRPYFYVMVEPGWEGSVKEKLLALSETKSPIISIELVDKRFFGRPVKVLKVTTVIPEYVREYREKAREVPGVKDVLEADVRFALRYMIDKGVKPFRWYKARVREISKPGYRVSRQYMIEEGPEEIEPTPPLTRLKSLGFDIEVFNSSGSPRASRDPVIIIGVIDGGVRQFWTKNANDKSIIQEFVEYIQSQDPDIIYGYNSNRFDWPYLQSRARVNKIKLDVGRRADSEPTTSVHGHISIAGRLNIDIYDFAEEIPEIKMKTLEEVADYFGIMKKSDRIILDWMDIPKLWSGDESDRRLVLQYNRDDLEATRGLAQKFIPFGIQLSSLTGIPLDQVMAASVGFRLEFYLMRQAFKYNELVPNRVERKAESYKGAIVLKPKPGVHENVVVLDFTSMYPSIMIKYNVGPDTLLKEGEEDIEAYEAPDVGHKFRKEPPGFFKSVLKNLLDARKRIRDELKKLDKNDPNYEILNERQKAMKLLANAAYGYMGWPAARWYCRECAEAVTAWGRHNILSAIRKARELGLEIIYGDTDSLFVKNKPGVVEEFIKWIESDLGFEIKIDKIYRRVFFTEAKKRYVGLTVDGETDVVGFEAIRGDWAEVAKEVQFEVARLVLEEGDTSKAVEYVRRLIQELKEKKIPINKLIIWKTLTKPIEAYDVEAPHVKAAMRYREYGITVMPGDKVGYVIVKGGGKISDKAVPYFAAKLDDIDDEYYIEHQIIPAALRILKYFGISEAKLRNVATSKQKSLFEYFS